MPQTFGKAAAAVLARYDGRSWDALSQAERGKLLRDEIQRIEAESRNGGGTTEAGTKSTP